MKLLVLSLGIIGLFSANAWAVVGTAVDSEREVVCKYPNLNSGLR